MTRKEELAEIEASLHGTAAEVAITEDDLITALLRTHRRLNPIHNGDTERLLGEVRQKYGGFLINVPLDQRRAVLDELHSLT